MKKCKAAIFDLDGVIVDTAKYHYLAWKRLAAELGFDFKAEHNEQLKGVSRMKSLEILLEIGGLTLDEAQKAELAEKKNRWYLEYIDRITPSEILPGVIDFIKCLKSRSIKIALGSASKNAKLILNRLEVSQYFDEVVDGNDISNAKPDPEVFLTAARKLGINADACTVFEDSAAGIEAAKNAGMSAVGIGRIEILKSADLVISGFNCFDKSIIGGLVTNELADIRKFIQ